MEISKKTFRLLPALQPSGNVVDAFQNIVEGLAAMLSGESMSIKLKNAAAMMPAEISTDIVALRRMGG